MLPKIAEVAELIVLTAAGDQRAFGRLYGLTYDKLRRTVLVILPNPADTEEALQEVYVKIWRHAGSYRQSTFSPVSWLAKIGRNQALDFVRQRRLVTFDIDDHPYIVDPQLGPEAIVVETQRRALIEISLSRLKPKASEIARDALVHGYPYVEVAALHGIPVNTVKTSVRRSMQHFRNAAKLLA